MNNLQEASSQEQVPPEAVHRHSVTLK